MVTLVSRRTVLAFAMAVPHVAVAALASTRSTLTAPDGREIAVWSWKAQGRRIGIVAFSHGALSAPWKYERLIEPWVRAGYDVLAPLHVDSVDHPRTADFPGLASWKARLEDMQALSRHIGVAHVTAGHSYGALTALVMGGAQGAVPEGMAAPLRDGQTTCVVALSPPPPIPGLIGPTGYAGIAVPALVQTGDRDDMPGFPPAPDGWKVHLAAYDAAPAGGDRYLLLLAGVDHYFGNAICEPARPGPPQLAQLAQAINVSELFMAAYGSGDAGARRKLDARLAEAGPVVLKRK